jgi:hypothetical protein
MTEEQLAARVAMRKKLAALSFSEKIKILEKLRDRSKAIAASGLRRKMVKAMPKCLFCAIESDSLTEEHVFPAGLGGTLTLKNAVCRPCNGGFSRDFEEEIVKRFEHIRYVLRIPDRRGNIPDIDVKVEFEGKEIDGRLMGTGSLRLKPIFTIENRDGVQERVARYVSVRQQEDLRKQGWEMAETTPGGDVQGSFSGRLEFIDSLTMLRTVTKIAYTALAFRADLDFARPTCFDDAREYIRIGSGATRAAIFLNEPFLTQCQQGPHQHSVVLVARRDIRRIDAIVRLFGSLCYMVNLAENYDGVDFSHTLVFDAQHGKVAGFNDVLVASELSYSHQVEYVNKSKDTIWNDRLKSGEWFTRFLDAAIQPTHGK